MLNQTTKFVPEFDVISEMFGNIIDIMIKSVSDLPRVEYFLFQQVDDLEVKPLMCIELDPSKVKEDILAETKGRIGCVIQANSHGPQK